MATLRELAAETLCDHLRTVLACVERDALARPSAAAELSAELRDAVDAGKATAQVDEP